MDWTHVETEGHLTLIIGNMFSGKTTVLRETLGKYLNLGLTVCYINTKKDIRTSRNGNGKFSTHSALNLSSDKLTDFKLDKLSDFTPYLEEYQVIGIDESHFFGETLVSTVLEWVKDYNKCVVISILSGTSDRKPFSNNPLDLFSEADERKLVDNAFCSCCWTEDKKIIQAPFTSRLIHDDDSELKAGGHDTYIPTCRRHHNKITDDSFILMDD